MITNERFTEIFEKYVDDVTSFLYMYAADRSELKDLVQEVFIKIWDARLSINADHPSFKGYLLKTARNHALKKLRRQKRYGAWVEEYYVTLKNDEDDEIAISSENLFHLDSLEDSGNQIQVAYQAALNKIPPGALKIYMLNREDGLTYPEIADMLQISIKTVETQMSRALKILRSELKNFRNPRE